MLNAYSQILIQQIPNSTYPNRNNILIINTIDKMMVSNSNEDLIQTAEFTISRKIQSILRVKSNYDYTRNSSKAFDVDSEAQVEVYNITYLDFSNIGMSNIQGAEPLFIYGDMVQINAGYTYYDENGNQLSSIGDGNGWFYAHEKEFPPQNNGDGQKRSLLFTGYITEISAQFDIRVKCQDYMAFFFQLLVKDVNILSTNTNKSITNMGGVSYEYGTLQGGILGLFDIMNGNAVLGVTASSNAVQSFTTAYNNNKLKSIYNDGIDEIVYITDLFKIKFNDTTTDDRFGDLKGINYTVGDWFRQLKDNGWAHIFFYPNSYTLNTSIFRYNHNPFSLGNPNGYQSFLFTFQENILTNKLEYKRTDTLLQGAIVKSTFTITGVQKPVPGVDANSKPEKTTPIQVFVGTPGGKIVTFLYGRKSASIPLNQVQENALEADMKQWGTRKLADYYYEGYRGSVTIFGYPYVRHGDQITIEDKNYPERTGTYMCNKVIYTSGTGIGLRQEVFLGEKITGRTYKQI